MKFVLYAAVILIVIGGSRDVKADRAFPLVLNFEGHFSPSNEKTLHDILNSALAVVEHFPPKGYENNLFNWTEDRKTLKGKNFAIVFTTSDSSLLDRVREGPGGLESDMDSVTIMAIAPAENEMAIFLCILVDRIFYNESGVERKDGFSRLVVALASEIYGSVQHFLTMPIDTAKSMTLSDRITQEQRQFEASIAFLKRVMASPEFKKLTPTMQKSFPERLAHEEQGLASWKAAKNRPR